MVQCEGCGLTYGSERVNLSKMFLARKIAKLHKLAFFPIIFGMCKGQMRVEVPSSETYAFQMSVLS